MRQDIPTLQKRVQDAAAQLEQLKNVQPLSGDSWIFYRHISANEWDIHLTNTAANYNQLFKLTVNVADPTRGFANMFYKVDHDYTQHMRYDGFPAVDEPYSYWLRISHATYTTDPGRIRVKFYLFSPQEGTFTITPQ